MVCSDWLDPQLESGLDPAAVTALEEWCSQTEISYGLDRWLTAGRSPAIVGVVFELHPRDPARQLVMKLDTAPSGPDGQPRLGEFARHRRAIAEAAGFAEDHLCEPVHHPIRVGDGRWFVFQRVAGGSLRELVTLSTLMQDVVRPPRRARQADAGPSRQPRRPSGPMPTGATLFADACGDILRSIFEDWVGGATLTPLDVPDILRRQLGDRLAPGTRLHRLAAAHPGPTLTVDGEDHPLPNPFALALDPQVTAGIRIRTFVGRAHGDLHVDNILVPDSPQRVSAAYRLIDLSRYAADAVLTRDPVHLVLHILARTLVDLSAPQRTAVIDLLLDPEADGDLVPGWLSLLLDRVHAATDGWARRDGLVDLWHDQLPLSLLACALTMLGRASTRPEDHSWFLRLAANSAVAFLDRHRPPGRPHAARPDPAGPAAGVEGPERADDPGASAPRGVTPRGVAPLTRARSPVAGASQSQGHQARGYDLFLSFARPDEAWAAWIVWKLEATGYFTLYPAAPDPAGTGGMPRGRRAITMLDGFRRAERTLVVLSPAYLDLVYLQPDWQAAARAGQGCFADTLVPIRVEDCAPPDPLGVATPVPLIDLVGLDEESAARALLRGVNALGVPPRRAAPGSDRS